MAPASKAMIETLFIAKFFPLKISQKDVFVDNHNNVIKNKQFDVAFYREEQRFLSRYTNSERAKTVFLRQLDFVT